MTTWADNRMTPPIRLEAKPGKRYGRLTLVEEGPRLFRMTNGKRQKTRSIRQWLMRCDCGAEKLLQPSNVIRGMGLGCAKRLPSGTTGVCAHLGPIEEQLAPDLTDEQRDEEMTLRLPERRREMRNIGAIVARVPNSVFDLGRMA